MIVDRTARRQARRVALLAAGLAIPAVVIATQLYVGFRMQGASITYRGALVLQLCHWEWWAVAGPVVWRLEKRWPIVPPDRRRSLYRHAAMAPAVAAAMLFLFLGSYHLVIRLPLLSGWFTGFDRSFASTAVYMVVSYFHVELLIYAGIVAVAHAVRASALLRVREHESLRLTAELTDAKLKTLRTQLQPHFLFNTLHTIGSMVLQRRNDRAVRLISELGELLRGTLAHRDTEMAPLRDEIDYLRRYLKIEHTRFGDRLRLQWDVQPDVLDVPIPPFILQPVLENAFRHGISRREGESMLSVSAKQEDGSLRITIFNEGPQLPDDFSLDTVSGYGLKNVTERLEARHPPGRMDIANEAGGVRVSLILPVVT